MSGPANSVGYLLSENVALSSDDGQRLIQLTDILNKNARNTNAKDIGRYFQEEIINGQQFFGNTPQETRSVYRKCFSFGAIAAGATLNIPHTITGLTALTRLYGSCVTNVVDYRPIPFVSPVALNQGIMILLAGANIVIVNGAGAPNITSGIIVAEYLKS